ncbi:MAG: peptidylprolyl isomerase [Planctomycetota bacterium]|jgi:peptidyl-prolyl cis-trans isomerase C
MKNYLTIFAVLVIFAAVFVSGCAPQTKTESTAVITEMPAETTTDTPAVAEATAVEEVPAEISPEKTTPLIPPETKPDTETKIVAKEKAVPPSAEITPEPEDTGIAVTVNGVDILESDLEKRVTEVITRQRAQGQGLPPVITGDFKRELERRILPAMIVETLMAQQAKKENIVVNNEDVDNHINNLLAQQNLSMADFEALLTARGTSIEQVKESIAQQLPYQKLLEAQWAGKINVTEEDANTFYNENPQQFEIPEQVRASHILIKPDTSDANTNPDETKAAAMAKAQDLLKQIQNAADFATLAKEHSACPSAARGGDLNFFAKGQMVPPFDKAAFELKVGQVSDIVETGFGYHIIKLTDHKPAATVPFLDAKDSIINNLTQQKQRQIAEEYIESLKSRAEIVYPPGKEPPLNHPGLIMPPPPQ